MSRTIRKRMLISALCACFFFNAAGGCIFWGKSHKDVNKKCQKFLDEVQKRVQKTAPETINRAGLYEDVKRLSVKEKVEANHIPPKSCTEGVKLYSNRANYVALSTAYDVHRKAGTTRSRAVRDKITKFLKSENIVGALKLQICEDYIETGSFDEYKTGLNDTMKMLSCLNRNDGEPILSEEEYKEMITFLTGESASGVPIIVDRIPVCINTEKHPVPSYFDTDEL